MEFRVIFLPVSIEMLVPDVGGDRGQFNQGSPDFIVQSNKLVR